MRLLHHLATGLTLVAFSTTAIAQSASPLARDGVSDARIQVGIVVPLGGAGNKAERAPRFEAWGEHGPQRTRSQAPLRTDPLPVQPVRFGVTLNKNPQLMLNGRVAPQQDGRRGISGLGVAGIVVGVLVVAAAVFVIEYKTSGLGD